jgi:hypothetical protein
VRTGGKVEEVGHRKGRPNFHEVVGHMHNLAPKGTTGGDQWLEYKGKGSVQAPGDPNRSHLYHVLHQTGDHKVYTYTLNPPFGSLVSDTVATARSISLGRNAAALALPSR